jgi:predicted enzyme related to lactoylglutathione lyase
LHSDRNTRAASAASIIVTVSNIIGVLARVFVDDLDAALPVYRALADDAEPQIFTFRDVRLARVGRFLLLGGDTDAYRDRVATLIVRSLDPVLATFETYGGEVLEGPSAAPNGRRLIARHPDGSVFEYLESAAAA